MTVAAIRDVTERKRFEEEKQQIHRAEEEIRRRDDMLTIASHELRAPVGSIQLQLGILQRTAAETALGLVGMRERMAKVERYAGRLAKLIGNLLDVSQGHFERLPLKLEDADLSVLTRETVDMLREDVERTGSSIRLDADLVVAGQWDPARIEQVIANLVLNAAKYGLGKPITVTVDADQVYGRVTVSDGGVGIALEDHRRIFEKFQRAASEGAAVGLGLGLYIARQIVLAHGGAIRLQSALGAGSEFTVKLPRAGPREG